MTLKMGVYKKASRDGEYIEISVETFVHYSWYCK